MAGNEAGGGNEPLPLLDEDWRQLRVMRSHLAHSAAFQDARRCCTPQDMKQNAQDHEDEMEVLGSIYGEDMIWIPDLGRGTRQSAQVSSGTSGESSGHSSGGQAGDEPRSFKPGPHQHVSEGLSAFLVLVHVTLDGPITIQACVGSSPCESLSASTPGSWSSSSEGGSQASSTTDNNRGNNSNGSDTANGEKPTAHGDSAATTRGELSKSQNSIMVSHLPPLRLLVVLPSTYPSSSPPLFSLLCHWLPPPLLSALASHLHSLWAEQQGTPVVYTWAAWLATDGLQHLGMERTVTLSPLETATPPTPGTEGGSQLISSGGKGKGPVLLEEQETAGEKARDGRAAKDAGCSEVVSEGGIGLGDGEGSCGCSFVCSLLHSLPHTSLSFLAQYSRERETQLFNAGIHECGICLRELPGADFLVSPLCSHFFCKPCSKHFANALVAEGNLGGLKCPDTSCRAVMPYEFLRSLLEPEVFQRWEALTLQRALDCMEDVVYCPRCQAVVVEEASEHFALCGRCSFSFCSLCLSTWHGKGPCMSLETRLQLLKAEKLGKRASEEVQQRRSDLEQQEALCKESEESERLARMERDMEQQVANLKLLASSFERCPRCKIPVEKDDGCNHVNCCNCGAYFCFGCMSTQCSGCWERKTDGERQRQIAKELAAEKAEGYWQEGNALAGPGGWFDKQKVEPGMEVPSGFARKCPFCWQLVPKDGTNNCLHCFACDIQFCGHCGEILTTKSFRDNQSHFGQDGCSLHTAW